MTALLLKSKQEKRENLSFYAFSPSKFVKTEIGQLRRDKGRIAFSPFTLGLKGVAKGEHTLTLTLFGTRYNTFSALHNLNADKKRIYIGPDYWRSENEAWDYGYHTRPMGILATPSVKIVK